MQSIHTLMAKFKLLDELTALHASAVQMGLSESAGALLQALITMTTEVAKRSDDDPSQPPLT